MAGFSFSIDRAVQRQIRRKLNGVASNIERAQSRAANRSATSTVAFFSKQTRKTVNVKAARLKKSARIRRAKPRNTTASIDITGAHIPLTDMGARQTKRGVTVRKYKTTSRTILKSAFLATMRSGHRGAYRRKDKRRLPIKEQFGPSVINLWKHRDAAISRHAIITLQKEVKRQIEYYRNR